MRIAPNPRRPTVGPPLNVSVRSTGVRWSGMMRRAPLLPGGLLVIRWRIAVIGRVIAGWVGRGRCGTGRSTDRDARRSTDRDTRADARAIHGAAVDGTAIGSAAVGGSADGGSAIGAASGSTPIGSTDSRRT